VPSQTEHCGTTMPYVDEGQNAVALLILIWEHYKSPVSVKWKTTWIGQLRCGLCSKLVRWNYEAIFKITTTDSAQKIDNCNAANNFNVAEANTWMWRQQKQKLINANFTWRSCSDCKYGHFHKTKQETAESVNLEGKAVVVITWEAIKHNVRKLAISHNFTEYQFKATTGCWCVGVMGCNGLFLCRTSLWHNCPADFEGKLISFSSVSLGLT
jgi:predicted nucleic-acid-binding Zn-ribbon protein